MPPLVSVSIPAYSPSSSSSGSYIDKGKAPVIPQPDRRTYNDEPLPVKLSDNSPLNARIIGRVLELNGAIYQLKIGEAEVNGVTIDEILDFVSAQHLEEYENQQFEEEAELLRIAEVEQERREEERQQRKRAEALRKGTVIYQEFDGTNDGNVDSTDGAEMHDGRHGRARPTYRHLFKKVKERRRRKRDPETGELMPLSDEEEEGVAAIESSDDELLPALRAAGSYVPLPEQQEPLSEQPKRRRRKRDPRTGELVPLEAVKESIGPEKKKRHRRRRHPLTNELMPYGWRYDPNAPAERQASVGGEAGVGAMSPAMKRLSISQEHTAKRVKLDHQSSSATSSSALQVPPDVFESASDSEETSDDVQRSIVEGAIHRPVPGATRGQLGVAPMLNPTPVSTLRSSPARNTMTSIVQPSAAALIEGEESEDEEDELAEGEWIIKAILAHHMSDPRTHLAELRKKPVMLYQVKWEGFDQPSWEPVESFPDRSVVQEYHQRIQSQATGSDGDELAREEEETTVAAQASSLQITKPQSSRLGRQYGSEEDEEDEEEGTYEVERVVAHLMSDPLTHGPDFGKEPVMLYRVKWKGYEGLTWEPMDSFEDRRVIHSYRKKVGLPDIEGEDDEDESSE